MRRNYKLERLQNGESFITSEKGNSMVPLIKSGQKHKLAPATWEEVEVGDIAYCKVKGSFYTHLVTAKDDKKGCQISNNKGRVNGWTKAVFGVVIEVVGGKHKRKKQKNNNKKTKKMEEKEKELLVLKTKLEVYKEVDKNLDDIQNGSIDMVFDYSDEVYRIKNKLEEDIWNLELEIEDAKIG